MNKQLDISYKTNRISHDALIKVAQEKNLESEITQLKNSIDQKYSTNYASLYAPHDVETIKQIEQLVSEKKKLSIDTLFIIGIGGSNLGSKAIHEALNGKHHNELNPLQVYFIETVDTDDMSSLLLIMKSQLKQRKKILVTVITKSGTTTETIANFQVIAAHFKEWFGETYRNYIVAITDKDSTLWNCAQKENFACLEIPKLVGGRYSVFSAVGLFPLLFIGINIQELLEGTHTAIDTCTHENISENPAALGALTLFINSQNDIKIHDTFLFSVECESIGKWYRQLLAESIGKEKNNNGEQIFTGVTPTVSIGSIDLHSVAQLYLGGPYDKFTTFITIEKPQETVTIPHHSLLQKQFPHLTQKTFHEINNAMVNGTKKAYEKNNRPFCSIIIPEKNAFYLGQLLQLKMIETIYLGYLLNINPFDQPNVELYKKETHALLNN